ncbi:hypothetical protein INR49_019341 [Caranx melampygus]|nr:hypothetical protein INR49_019341 [Caranx melampygus]
MRSAELTAVVLTLVLVHVQAGHLVSMHNVVEYSQVLCLAFRANQRKEHFWIGGRSKYLWHSFQWTDKTPFEFERWAFLQPDKEPGEECVEMNYETWGYWNNAVCSGRKFYRTDVIIPSRTRFRSCNNPAPSIEPPGDVCPGADFGVEDCTHLPKCPEDGNWGAWSPPGPCTVTCGEGLQLSTRTCNSPPPKYGGRYCDGPSSQTHVCQSPCPVDGLWSDWSVWSQCSSSCHSQTRASTKTRQRFCSSPAPSTTPPGKPCVGEAQQTERCSHLPFCPVDGGWGPWSAFEPCSVTCGVGQRVSVRTCNNPTPQHGGKQCPGDRRQTKICHTDKFCPVDGEWSAWTPWAKCKGDTLITCKNKVVGLQSKERTCLHQDHGGAFCPGAKLADFRLCNDVNNCPLKGTWQNWGEWSLCLPPCGETSQRSRTRFCQPVYTGYRTTYGQQRERVAFVGTPQVDCGPEPDGGIEETMPCLNAPPAPNWRDSIVMVTGSIPPEI